MLEKMQAQAHPPRRKSPHRITSPTSGPKSLSMTTAQGPRQPANPRRGAYGKQVFFYQCVLAFFDLAVVNHYRSKIKPPFLFLLNVFVFMFCESTFSKALVLMSLIIESKPRTYWAPVLLCAFGSHQRVFLWLCWPPSAFKWLHQVEN